MMRFAIIILFACCVVCYGKQPKKIASKTQAHIDAVKESAKSNDWKMVRAEYDKIEWKNIQEPEAVLSDLSNSLKHKKNVVEIRREIKTRYELLRGKGDADLEDNIEATPIPVVDLPVLDLPFVAVRDMGFLNEMELWETRYSKRIDYYDDKGDRIVPMRGTVLWAERKAIMEAVEDGGDYDKLWTAYDENVRRAIGRRVNLKKGTGRHGK